MSDDLPAWKCHKIVRASKITSAERASVDPGDGAPYVVDLECGAYRVMDAGMVARRVPQVGDYYVVYEDGYASLSPGDVFEAGYTRLRQDQER